MARPSAFTFPPNVNQFWNPIFMPCAPRPPDLKVCSPAPASEKRRSSKNSNSFANNEERALPSEHVSPRRQHLDSCRAGRRVRELLERYAVRGVRFLAPEVAFEEASKYLP